MVNVNKNFSHKTKIFLCLFFFIRVEAALLELGWKRITNKYDETFKLKWVECKSSINYSTLKEGKSTMYNFLIPSFSMI